MFLHFCCVKNLYVFVPVLGCLSGPPLLTIHFLCADEEELQQSRHIVESTKVLLREGKSDDSTDEEEILYEHTQLWIII